MENRELTKTRVRNLMNDIPNEVKHRRMAKVRNTMKRTFSGMNTLLGQLAQSKTDKIREARKRKRNITILVLSIIAVILAIILVIVFK
jgi:t-SNARE complex subunit (syntaxin)